MGEVIGQVTGTIKESIARVELYTDAALSPSDWRLITHYERGSYDADGKLQGATQFGSLRVEDKFGDIKDEIVDGTITYGQLAQLIQKGCYKLRSKYLVVKAEQEATIARHVAEMEAAEEARLAAQAETEAQD